MRTAVSFAEAGVRQHFNSAIPLSTGFAIGLPCRGEGRGPGEKGAQEFMAVGKGVLAAAPLQVAVGRHEGGEAEPGLGHPADKGMGLRAGVGSLERAESHWSQKSWASGRSRTTARARAILRRRALTRRLRSFIRLRFSLFGLLGDFSISRTFPDISGHFLPLRAGWRGWDGNYEWGGVVYGHWIPCCLGGGLGLSVTDIMVGRCIRGWQGDWGVTVGLG